MNHADINKLVSDYGFSGETAEAIFRLAVEVERETRHRYFRLMQAVNNAAFNQEIAVKDIDKLVWDKSQQRLSK